MDPAEACRVLGVAPGATWAEVRAAHRTAIRLAHPDTGGSAERAALLNLAIDVLRVAPPVPAHRPVAPVDRFDPGDVDRCFVVDDRPGDLLARLADAGHDIGEVVFVDPSSGMLEIVVGEGGNVGQLAVFVGVASADGTPVSFTLDPLGAAPAPPIDGVVEALMAALRQA